ncbi:twin-arginine translocation signal domain-containing protein [Natrialbaceae archaeon AArc-T1-2]|uniref:twin-arginine translocation signal domain-containing protein n=1 Tax=Natrialbaceae archaeon AArc-T1-2 TaxID=3053904 RepID=UPI00255AAD74|nr:twin-arginine translocation signal domain-containing protein [Natrialbaceae archaeon AArc-T1-2]WIV68099.1 twin-arginine translocation signal domain-containing protein [Natrialbaceae archaeon AArc-T1-2]
MSENSDSRRQFLQYSGIVGAGVLTAGCLGSDDDPEEPADDGENGGNGNDGGEDDDDEGGNGNGDTGDLHPRYGYPSVSMDDEQPVENDHTVELLMDYPDEDEDRPPEFFFEPAGLAIEPGDVIRFDFHTPDHAVAAFHRAFGRTHRAPDDAEPVSSPMMDTGTYWLCAFDEPGVWDLYCPPHEFLGMGMRIVVGEERGGPATEPADPDYEGEERPPEPALAAAFNADALEPETILEEGDVPWADVGVGPGN